MTEDYDYKEVIREQGRLGYKDDDENPYFGQLGALWQEGYDEEKRNAKFMFDDTYEEFHRNLARESMLDW